MTVYRDCVPLHETRFGGDGSQTPTEAVVDALSAAAGRDPMALPPLYDAVDPDALDRLFEHSADGPDAGTMLGFTLEDWTVFVRSDGRILVCDATRTVPPTPVFAASEA